MRIDWLCIHLTRILEPIIYSMICRQTKASETKLKAADLITGYWYDVPWYDYVDIPMKHRMSLVTIVYHVGTADYPNMDISEPQVYSKTQQC